MPFIQETDQGAFSINLPDDIPDKTVASEIQRAMAGQPSSATLLSPEELSKITAKPEPTEAGPTSGSELFGAVAIPTAMSAGGGMIGGALAGPPGALVGEAIGDVGGYFINVAAGLEPFSMTQLGLAVGTPFVSRALGGAAIEGAKAGVRKSKVGKFALQEATKKEANRIRRNIETFNADMKDIFPDATRAQLNETRTFLNKAAQETEKRAQAMVKAVAAGSTTINKQELARNLPTIDESLIDDLYTKVAKVRDKVDIKAYRFEQRHLHNLIKDIETVNPAHVPESVRDLVSQITSQEGAIKKAKEAAEAAKEANKKARQLRSAELQLKNADPKKQAAAARLAQSQRRKAQAAKEKAVKLAEEAKKAGPPDVVSFRAVRESIKTIKRQQNALAYGDTADREQLHRLFDLRKGLESSMEAAEDAATLTPDAREMLKAANAATFKGHVQDELHYFIAQFQDRVADQETVDFGKILQKFRDPRNKEARTLRDNLKRLGILNSIEASFVKAHKQQVNAGLVLEKAKEGVKTAGKLPRATKAKKLEQPFMKEFTDPLEAIEPGNPRNIFQAALGGMTVGGAVYGTGVGTPAQAVGTAAIAAFPFVLSRMLMTPTGQKATLKLLNRSGNVYDQRFAGAAGAFLRATMAAGSAAHQPEQPTGQQQPGVAQPNQQQNETAKPRVENEIAGQNK